MNNEQSLASKGDSLGRNYPFLLSRHRIILLLILLLAAFLRFYRLPELPPGFNFDEGGDGVAGLEILAGAPKLWWRIGGGKEPLWPYLVAVGTVLWGQTPFTLRFLGALTGIVTVAAVYPFMAALFRYQQGKYLGLLTMLGLTLSGWHLHFSRLGFRAILLPLLSTLAFYFFWRMLETSLTPFPKPQSPTPAASQPTPRNPYTFLCALFMALSIYTYLAARLLPLVIILFYAINWLLRYLHRRTIPNSPLPTPYSLLLTFLLLLSPLIIYFLLNPADFAARSSTVSIFNPAWNHGDLPGTVWHTFTLTLSTFLALTGDANPLVNLPHQPALPLLLTIFFVLGFFISLLSLLSWRPRVLASSPLLPPYTSASLLLCWWLVMLAPAILAPEGAPHHLRLIGAIVPTYGLIAIGLMAAVNGLAYLLKASPPQIWSRRLAWLLPMLVFMVVGWQSYTNYFVRWPVSVDFTLPFDLHITRLAAAIATAPNNVAYVLPMDIRAGIEARHYSLDYLLPPASPYTYIPVDERNAERLLTQAAAGKDTLRVIRWTDDKHIEADAKEIITYLLATQAQLERVETFPVYNVESYQLGADCGAALLGSAATPCIPGQFRLPAIDRPVGANFEGLLRLDAVYVPPVALPGGMLPVALTVAPLTTMAADYKVSLRLLTPAGEWVAQKDRVLLHNFHQGTSLWPMESVNEYYLLPIPPDTPPGEYIVAVVIYHPDTIAPLVADGLIEVSVGTVLIGNGR